MIIPEVLILVAVSFGLIKLLTLPFTNHAKSSHYSQYNAEKLCQIPDDGAPTEYYRQGKTRKAVVEIKPGLRGVVVIGDDGNDPVIVTGYAAREGWIKKNLKNAERLEDL